MDKLEFKNHEIYLDKQGIVYIKVLENAHIDPTILKKLNAGIKKLSGKNKVLALVDARAFHTFTPEATAYLKKGTIDKTRIASAVVCNKLGIRMMIDNITKVQKAKSPVRMFSSEAQARAWLLSVKNKSKKK